MLTRTVRDAAAVLDSVCGPAAGDPCPIPGPEIPFAVTGSEPTKRWRCALQTTSPITNIGSDVAIAAERVARELQTRGHAIEEASPQVNEVASLAAERTIWIESTGWEIQRFGGMTGNPIDIDHVEPLSLAAYRLSRQMTVDDWFKAQAQCNAVRRSVAEFFNEYDVLITPAIASIAPKRVEIAGSDIDDYDEFMQKTGQFSPFTSLFNITGQPALTLPLATCPAGMPIGAQFVARHGEENVLFQLASYLELALPWKDRCPPVHAGTLD